MLGFWIKQGDTLPTLRCVVEDAGGAVDLTGATVVFHLRKKGASTAAINRPATVPDPTGGIAEFAWQTGETDVAGSFEAEFEFTFPNGKKLTAPNDGHLNVIIKGQLA